MVRYLAVAPDWRHHGIGTVLLCIMDQHGVPGDVTRRVFFGGCAPEEARFYQRAGFDVLQPGTPVPGEVLGSGVDFANINAEYPCCFIRPWSQQA
ncbi:GNAT family N-acetyltransferase [Brachybacterium alimentarium]|uniref:GNAT family N-acetyltransferase n=1 Tax=Brachybacterium alimentarium TaxID=47845 RepID=UPI003FD29A12